MAGNSLKLGFPVLFLIAFLYLPSLIHATNFHYCDKKANYKVKVNQVDISPNPVVSGKDATFSIAAATDKALSGGKVEIDVSIWGVQIHSETHDLCSETSCPVSTGNFVIAHSQSLPGLTPPGTYTLKMKIKDGNGNEMTCISFSFSIKWGSSVADM